MASDFNAFPGGRYRDDGPFSGERFRQELLIPRLIRAMALGERLVVDIDDTGMAASFIEEVFGGLVRERTDIDAETLARTMKIVAPRDRSAWPYLHLAQHYIDTAFDRRQEQANA